MRHTLLVVTVKRQLKSVYTYGSYRKIKTGIPHFWTTQYTENIKISNIFVNNVMFSIPGKYHQNH